MFFSSRCREITGFPQALFFIILIEFRPMLPSFFRLRYPIVIYYWISKAFRLIQLLGVECLASYYNFTGFLLGFNWISIEFSWISLMR